MNDSSQISLDDQRETLLKILQSYGRVAVALSGGVDSAVVTKAAALACGSDAVAVTAKSPSLASGELEIAQEIADFVGIRHRIVETEEFQRQGYQQNAGNRCYFCKTELYEQVESLLPSLDVDVICNGANLDDLGDHRPGMQAAREHKVRSPLIEARLTKQDVRALAKFWGLEVWDKPAMPCLSSRIAYGVQVTPERVKRVDLAESFLRQTLSIRELRVRHEENELARIEVPVDDISRLLDNEVRDQIVSKLKEFGFKFVTVDLQGFRSGSMNEALPVVQLANSLSK